MDGPVVMAIDGNSLVHRSFHAQAHTAMHTDQGRPTWAVRGLLGQLVAAVERIRPAAVVVGFDDADCSSRREEWPTYKANRVDKLDTLVEQLASAVQVLRDLGVAVVVPPGLEADDVLASTATFARAHDASTVIVTSDRDAFALIDDTTRVLRIINGGVEASPLMTAERLVMLLGVHPSQYRDFAALRGDPSDNLPGVHGIGPRSAAALLTEFGSAAAAFADLDAVRTKVGRGVAARLGAEGAYERWQLNCAVMTMHADVALDLSLTSGPGVLPLDAARVDDCFRAQSLTWSAPAAVRVLAEVDAAPPREPVFTSWGESAPPARRLPKLPPRKPAMAQLTLF